MHSNRRLALLTILPLLLSLGGCGEDPMGPDNRMALLALGQCRFDQALQLADNAIERGSDRNQQQALMLKAAILRDRGDSAAAEALYPRIDETWVAVKRRALSPERRERDIARFIDIAHKERLARGLAPDCAEGAPPAAKS